MTPKMTLTFFDHINGHNLHQNISLLVSKVKVIWPLRWGQKICYRPFLNSSQKIDSESTPNSIWAFNSYGSTNYDIVYHTIVHVQIVRVPVVLGVNCQGGNNTGANHLDANFPGANRPRIVIWSGRKLFWGRLIQWRTFVFQLTRFPAQVVWILKNLWSPVLRAWSSFSGDILMTKRTVVSVWYSL